MDSLQRLTDIGFRSVGSWELRGSSLICHLLSEASTPNVLYAFANNREVLYIGKTTRPLSKRMDGYQNPGPTQRTNIRNHASIRELLENGRTVDIYCLVDTANLEYRGLRVNLAAGLEDTLIDAVNPPWNHNGR